RILGGLRHTRQGTWSTGTYLSLYEPRRLWCSRLRRPFADDISRYGSRWHAWADEPCGYSAYTCTWCGINDELVATCRKNSGSHSNHHLSGLAIPTSSILSVTFYDRFCYCTIHTDHRKTTRNYSQWLCNFW